MGAPRGGLSMFIGYFGDSIDSEVADQKELSVKSCMYLNCTSSPSVQFVLNQRPLSRLLNLILIGFINDIFS